MNTASSQKLTGAWLALITITIASVFTAEYLDQRIIAIAAIMAIAAIKVAIILRWFMGLGAAPGGVRLFLSGWTLACPLLIFALYCYAAPK